MSLRERWALLLEREKECDALYLELVQRRREAAEMRRALEIEEQVAIETYRARLRA